MTAQARFSTLFLVMALCSMGRAAQYPMESGDVQRHNRPLGASSVTAPLHPEWISAACPTLHNPVGGPVVLDDRIVQAFDNGLRCVSRADGGTLWTTYLGWGSYWLVERYLWNGPAYDPGRNLLYQGDLTGATFWMDPSDGHTVATHYEGSRPGSYQYSAPLFVNDRLYVGTGGSGFVCLHPDTQAVVWRYNFASTEGTCTPAYDSGFIYLPTTKGNIYCLRESDGALQWKAVSGSGQHAGIMVEGAYIYTILNKGQVQCRRKSDGVLVWTYQTESWAMANLASCGELLIASSDDRNIYGLNLLTGQRLWRRKFNGNFARCAPIVVCGTVYVSGCTGQYYALDGQTGVTKWSYDHTYINSFVDWAEADGRLFTADTGGRIFSFLPDTPGNPADCVCDLHAWTPTVEPVVSYSASPTRTSTRTPTLTFTQSPTLTASPTATPSATYTDTPTATGTSTPSYSPTISETFTLTLTVSPSYTLTASPTHSPTATLTATRSATPTASPSVTPVNTPTITLTPLPLDDPGEKGTYVYPDPVRGGKTCHAVIHNEKPCKARVHVFKANGEEAYRDETHFGNVGINTFDIDTSSLASGVYFYSVDIETDEGRKSHTRLSKFMVIK